MNSLIGLAIGFLFVMPIATLLHELGHATPQLIAGHKVEVALGNSEKAKVVQIGNLTLSVSSFSMNVGFASITKQGGKSLQAWSLVMGPLTSLLLCLSLYFTNSNQLPYIASYVINFGVYFSLAQFVMTALPIYYPSAFGAYEGMPSDGRQLLELYGLAKCRE